MEIQRIHSSDPRAHAHHIARQIHTLKEHCRSDILVVFDPAAKALFEAAADVLAGLEKAFTNYQLAE